MAVSQSRLTWNQGDIYFPETTSVEDFLLALKDAVDNSTYWSVEFDDTEYLVLTPVSGDLSDAELGAGSGLRIVVGGRVSSPRDDTIMHTSNTNLSDYLHVGLAPDGGNFGVTDGWHVTNPFGTERWSKYLAWGRFSSAVYLVESEEILTVVSVAGGNPQARQGSNIFIAGAIYNPIDDSVSDTNNRIYGIAKSWAQVPVGNGWAYQRDTTLDDRHFLNTILNTDNNAQMIVFRPGLDKVDFVERYGNSLNMHGGVAFKIVGSGPGDPDTRDTMGRGQLRPLGGGQALLPFYTRVDGAQGSPGYYVGSLRQMFAGPLDHSRKILVDSNGDEQAILWSSEGGLGATTYRVSYSIAFVN